MSIGKKISFFFIPKARYFKFFLFFCSQNLLYVCKFVKAYFISVGKNNAIREVIIFLFVHVWNINIFCLISGVENTIKVSFQNDKHKRSWKYLLSFIKMELSYVLQHLSNKFWFSKVFLQIFTIFYKSFKFKFLF